MRIVEFDCDGVLLDCSTATVNSKYGEGMRRVGLTFEDASTYGFSNFPESLRKEIYKSFNDPEVVRALKPYEGIASVLSNLYLQTLQKDDVSFVLRSGITDERVRSAKQEVLDNLLQQAVGMGNPKFSTELVLLSGNLEKPSTSPFIFIEDNPEYLITSKAKHKILVNHRYNSEESYPKLKDIVYTRVYKSADIYNAVISILNSHLD